MAHVTCPILTDGQGTVRPDAASPQLGLADMPSQPVFSRAREDNFRVLASVF